MLPAPRSREPRNAPHRSALRKLRRDASGRHGDAVLQGLQLAPGGRVPRRAAGRIHSPEQGARCPCSAAAASQLSFRDHVGRGQHTLRPALRYWAAAGAAPALREAGVPESHRLVQRSRHRRHGIRGQGARNHGACRGLVRQCGSLGGSLCRRGRHQGPHFCAIHSTTGQTEADQCVWSTSPSDRRTPGSEHGGGRGLLR